MMDNKRDGRITSSSPSTKFVQGADKPLSADVLKSQHTLLGVQNLVRRCSTIDCDRTLSPEWKHKACERCYNRARTFKEQNKLRKVLKQALENEVEVSRSLLLLLTARACLALSSTAKVPILLDFSFLCFASPHFPLNLYNCTDHRVCILLRTTFARLTLN